MKRFFYHVLIEKNSHNFLSSYFKGFNTTSKINLSTESDVDIQLEKAEERRRNLLETESRRRLSFPPRDFMQRLSTDNSKRNSKALDRKR